MAQANYREIETLLGFKIPFKGNSCHATLDGNTYAVYSYSTLIATLDTATKEINLNERKYSVTTSRLQNLIRKAWAI